MRALIKGVSLIELLISMSLSTILLSIMLHVYVQYRKNFILLQQRLEREFDVQLATGLLLQSAAMAGFTPCHGFKTLGQPPNQKLSAYKIINEHHIFFSRMDEHFANAEISANAHALLLDTPLPLKKNETILVSDCYHVEAHQLEQVSKLRQKTLLKISKPLLFSYQAPVYVGRFITDSFFVRYAPSVGLYYQNQRAEKLTPYIQALIVREEANQLYFKIGLDNQEELHLYAGIRSQ